MRVFCTVILLIISLNIIGCSFIPPGNSNIVLMKEYKEQRIRKDLTIVQLFDDPVINEDIAAIDISGSLDTDKEHSLLFIRNITSDFMASKWFDNVNYYHIPVKHNLVESKLVLNYHDTMKIFLPQDGSLFSSDSIKSGYVLFIDNLHINKTGGISGAWIGGNYVGGASPSLYQILNFALWDNEKGKVISYGKTDSYSDIYSNVNKKNWASAIKGIVDNILSYSSFQQ
jgi:hypothetical protein